MTETLTVDDRLVSAVVESGLLFFPKPREPPTYLPRSRDNFRTEIPHRADLASQNRLLIKIKVVPGRMDTK
jgi:hypothetical protein